MPFGERVAAIYDDLPQEAALFLERAAVPENAYGATGRWSAIFVCLLRKSKGPSIAVFEVRQLLTSCLYERRTAVREASGWRFAHPLLRESVLRISKEAGRLLQHHQVRGVPSALWDSVFGWISRPFRPSFTQAVGQTEAALEAMLAAAQSLPARSWPKLGYFGAL